MGTLADNPPVQLHPEGQGIQSTPFGAVPIGQAQIDTGMMGSALPARITEPTAPTSARARVALQYDLQTLPTAPGATSPGSVIKAAKARIKELRTFLRSAKKAEKELRELERLVAASKKPLASVRDIRRTAG